MADNRVPQFRVEWVQTGRNSRVWMNGEELRQVKSVTCGTEVQGFTSLSIEFIGVKVGLGGSALLRDADLAPAPKPAGYWQRKYAESRFF